MNGVTLRPRWFWPSLGFSLSLLAIDPRVGFATSSTPIATSALGSTGTGSSTIATSSDEKALADLERDEFKRMIEAGSYSKHALGAVVMLGERPQDPDDALFQLVSKQAGLTKASAASARKLGTSLLRLDVLRSQPEPPEPDEKRDALLRELTRDLARRLDDFFLATTGPERARCCVVAGKFKVAQNLIPVMYGDHIFGVTDPAWDVMKHERNYRALHEYLGRIQGGREAASARLVEADFRQAVEFMVSLDVPPNVKQSEVKARASRLRKWRDQVIAAASRVDL